MNTCKEHKIKIFDLWIYDTELLVFELFGAKCHFGNYCLWLLINSFNNKLIFQIDITVILLSVFTLVVLYCEEVPVIHLPSIDVFVGSLFALCQKKKKAGHQITVSVKGNF